MGIKGIYGEIGPGERISLSKLAVEKFEQTGRPLRIAIDVSIWQFQILAGQGGSNPALRTFYYRLLRMLSSSVQCLFVFDGPHKPPFKRNKKTGHYGGAMTNMSTKRLLKLFGFPYHDAPGEAEAECAYLQREGIVDAVLSEDVDTLMFGCGQTLRNWSSEGTRGNKSPTHVSVYNAKATKEGKAGLDREGMILVALMSGGDYIPEGIPGCGIKAACEAARAGFGKTLCQLSRTDETGLRAWRENLAHEFRTNENKFFRVKHKALAIPEDFPNKDALGYYTHPVVSSAQKLERLRSEIVWDGPINVTGLRVYVAEHFDWTCRGGAIKFIRGLAPVMLIYKLRIRKDRRESNYGDIILTALNELELVKSICGVRTHFSTDGIPELRLIYHPLDIVGINLDDEILEPDESADYGRDGLAPLNEDGEAEAYISDTPIGASPTKRGSSLYDPTQPDRAWVPHTIAKAGIPLKVEDYEESLRKPKKATKAKAAPKKTTAKGGMQRGAMDKFVKTSKPGLGSQISGTSKASRQSRALSPDDLPPRFLAPSLDDYDSAGPISKPNATSRTTRASAQPKISPTPAKSIATRSKSKNKFGLTKQVIPNANPWTLASASSFSPVTAKVTKPIIQRPKTPDLSPFKTAPYIISSSPAISPSPQPNKNITPRKHSHSPSPLNSDAELELPNTVTISRGSGSHDVHPITPSKSASRPSPRKKISLDSPRMIDRDGEGRITTNEFGPEPVARRLDFGSAENGSRSQRESSKLPELRDLMSPESRITTPEPPTINWQKSQVIDLSSSPPEPARPKAVSSITPTGEIDDSSKRQRKSKQTTKKYIMLRESLPGSWKEIEEDEMTTDGRKRKANAWRQSQIQVLDLSQD